MDGNSVPNHTKTVNHPNFGGRGLAVWLGCGFVNHGVGEGGGRGSEGEGERKRRRERGRGEEGEGDRERVRERKYVKRKEDPPMGEASPMRFCAVL